MSLQQALNQNHPMNAGYVTHYLRLSCFLRLWYILERFGFCGFRRASLRAALIERCIERRLHLAFRSRFVYPQSILLILLFPEAFGE